jgi:hypothetical protein
MSNYVFKYKTVDGNALTNNTWISENASGEQYQEDGWWCVPIEFGDYGKVIQYGFENTNLTEVDTGDGIVTIGDSDLDNPFKGCNYLKKLYIGKNVTYITNLSLRKIPNIEVIVIDPENEEYDSRDNCNAIINKGDDPAVLEYGCKFSTVPYGVGIIDEQAFYDTGVVSLTSYAVEPPTFNDMEPFGYPWDSNGKTLYVPKESVSAYQASDWADYFANIVQIPDPEPPVPPTQHCGFNLSGMQDTSYVREANY